MQLDEIQTDSFDSNVPTPLSQHHTNNPLNFTVHPGFMCFFQDWAQQQKLTQHECYQRALKSHFQLQRLRNPFNKILKTTAKNLESTAQQIANLSNPFDRFYMQKKGGELYRVQYGKEKAQEVAELQQQLQILRKRRQEALCKKREQFKRLREEQEARKQKEEAEKRRREQVLDSIAKRRGKYGAELN